MSDVLTISNKNTKVTSALVVFLFLVSCLAAEGTLFVGLEGSSPSTFTSDMTGFPNVTWTSGYSFDVSGAAAAPDGTIYLCEGAFTTHLYQATLTTAPQQICTISEDMSALAYGNDTLYGFSNYADPKGIYSIDPASGAATLVLDVYTGTGFRFFALDFNPEDGLFYGYTEYGASGLYSINTDTGEMIQLTGSIPASNGQGRGLAVGNNTVYLTATRGDDGIPYFAYDISQGAGGSWVEFPNPYPAYHSTGGAAFVPAPIPTIQINGHVVGSDEPNGLEGCDVILSGEVTYQVQTDLNGYFLLDEVLANADYSLEISLGGYETYNDNIQAGTDDIDLGTILMNEIVYPATDVVVVVNDENTEAEISWNPPAPLERELESYDVYRFLEANATSPVLWELIADNIDEETYIDADWISLELDFYQYAVVAIYTSGLEAEAALSNVVEKLPVFNPPQNFTVDEYSGLATWDPPVPAPGVTLIEYSVFLDAEMFTTTETEWLFEDLINGVIYIAAIQAVYDLGESNVIELEFQYLGTGAGNNLISTTELLGNYPNPFNPSTTISFSISNEQNEQIELIIYNLKGQKIKTFSPSLCHPELVEGRGEASVIWNGTNENNQPVSSGIYFYKLKAGGYEQTRRMLLMK
ncbi:MAG: hypothetical protein DRI23_10430 [Candidatus Cloacimonadota bacterium]|nr:MAG: hypothetical protein DRI23_10430 [Candidatus Cloacimonadota bacterium]